MEKQIEKIAALCRGYDKIDPALYEKYDVKRGLRDLQGRGVVAGLTDISEVCASEVVAGATVPCAGKLFYRGVNVEDLIGGMIAENRFGFEEVVFLLLCGRFPDAGELEEFNGLLAKYRQLPSNFVRDVIMKAPSADMMNTLARSVLTLYSYDDNPNDLSVENVVRQSLQLIARFPLLSVYGYQTFRHYHDRDSLVIHAPVEGLSTAENILHTLRSDSQYTALEARVLDVALVLHAEHGGGNNSSFTTRVVTSSGTDTYSAIAAALGSLKGPRHGGANIKVVQMFADLKEQVHDWKDEEEISSYLTKLLRKEAFDHSGLIYGMGHAVYSISDPRAVMLKSFVEKLAEEKGRTEEYQLYATVERVARETISTERKIYKGVSANVDFYSGFAYSMLGLPMELYTPIFAIARIAGWSAHRLEELVHAGKIIRPAYKNIGKRKNYTPIAER